MVVNDRSSLMSFLTSHMYNCLCTRSALQLLEKKLKYLHGRGASFMVGPYEGPNANQQELASQKGILAKARGPNAIDLSTTTTLIT